MKALVLLAALATSAFAAELRTVSVESSSMQKKVPVSIVLPKGYGEASEKRFPVVYLLHGAGGGHKSWAGKLTEKLVDEYGFIAVCPDGMKTSWWFDSPIDPSVKYETFVISELLPWVDANFRTVPERTKRAIMGGSMGGHGACWLGFRHKNLFGAVGNVYGGVDLRPFPENWDIKLRLGTLAEHPENWKSHSVVTEAETLKNGELEFITMIGTNDFFLKVNRELHELLSRNKVEHIYIEMRGSDEPHSSHNGAFRDVAQIAITRYFHNYFVEGKGRL